MKQQWLRVTACAALFGLSNGAAFGAEDVPKLDGTAPTFAGVAWGSAPDTVKATLAQRGFTYAQSDDDGDLIFTQVSTGFTSHLFEVFNSSQKLVKSLVDIPRSDTDPLVIYDALSKTMIQKFGKPSAKFDDYTGQYHGATSSADKEAALAAGDGTLAMFWMYKDGSSAYVQVTSKLSVQSAFESRFMKARAPIGTGPAVVPPAAAAPSRAGASIAFTGPPGWDHTGSSDGRGVWRRTSDANTPETITVTSKAGFASLDALLQAEVNYVASLPDQFGYAPTDTTVCGNHPAKYLSYTWTGPDGTPITTEEVIAVFGNTGYSARYNKTITQNADTAAEHALSSICGPTGSR